MFLFIFGYIITFLFIRFILGVWTNIENIIGIFITVVCTMVVSLVISRKYYKFKLRKLILDDTQFNKTIKSLILEKNEVSINDLFGIFSSGKNKKTNVELRKLLNKKIFSWVSKYNLFIQGDKILLNSNNIIAFMDDLDKFFNEWNLKKKKKKY